MCEKWVQRKVRSRFYLCRLSCLDARWEFAVSFFVLAAQSVECNECTVYRTTDYMNGWKKCSLFLKCWASQSTRKSIHVLELSTTQRTAHVHAQIISTAAVFGVAWLQRAKNLIEHAKQPNLLEPWNAARVMINASNEEVPAPEADNKTVPSTTCRTMQNHAEPAVLPAWLTSPQNNDLASEISS